MKVKELTDEQLRDLIKLLQNKIDIALKESRRRSYEKQKKKKGE